MEITPRLIVHNGTAAIDWYAATMGAVEKGRFVDPTGVLVHAELEIGQRISRCLTMR